MYGSPGSFPVADILPHLNFSRQLEFIQHRRQFTFGDILPHLNFSRQLEFVQHRRQFTFGYILPHLNFSRQLEFLALRLRFLQESTKPAKSRSENDFWQP